MLSAICRRNTTNTHTRANGNSQQNKQQEEGSGQECVDRRGRQERPEGSCQGWAGAGLAAMVKGQAGLLRPARCKPFYSFTILGCNAMSWYDLCAGKASVNSVHLQSRGRPGCWICSDRIEGMVEGNSVNSGPGNCFSRYLFLPIYKMGR